MLSVVMCLLLVEAVREAHSSTVLWYSSPLFHSLIFLLASTTDSDSDSDSEGGNDAESEAEEYLK